MKLPAELEHLFGSKPQKQELFLSLFLDVDGVVAGAWVTKAGSTPSLVSHAFEPVAQDAWEDRTEAADRAIAALEEKSATSDFHKVTLGLPFAYLTGEGDIKKDIRGHIKKLTETLELKPMGFVPVYQAIVYKLKKDEGVPPSVILVGVEKQSITVSVYKVGNLIGLRQLAKEDDIAMGIEDALKGFQDLEVLPSRMRLYGSDGDTLAAAKSELLRYPWPTKVNFLHFPKIETISHEELITAISLAGASELGEMVHGSGFTVHGEEEVQEAEPEGSEEITEESNVVMVSPEALGFRKNDVLEKPADSQQLLAVSGQPEKKESVKKQETRAFPMIKIPKFPALTLPTFPSIRMRMASVVAGIALFAVVAGGFLYWKLPAAIVTIYELPQTLDEKADITIDLTATVADSEQDIIPGTKQDKSISGEKTILVTGKKQIGDPAKGAVKIYNKTFSTLNVPKGTVFTGGDLQFTLDAAVSVASASAVTFTTNTGALTASTIGTKGNVPSGTIFSMKGYSLSEAAAQNDQAFAGGTSRDVTVVSRADMDALIAALTKELIAKTKTEQPTGTTGDDVLIEETVKTAVTAKEFTEELDQEAKELHGKLSLTISGMSYSKRDAVAMFSDLLKKKIPAGYAIVSDGTSVVVSGVKIKKDGSVTAKASATAIATPVISIPDIQKSLAGKQFVQAQEYLRSLPGIGSADFSFRWTAGTRMPINASNISVTVAVQE